VLKLTTADTSLPIETNANCLFEKNPAEPPLFAAPKYKLLFAKFPVAEAVPLATCAPF
jgi:hypothetical protein